MTPGGVTARPLHQRYAGLVDRVHRFSHASKPQNVDSAAARVALLITRDEARIPYQQAQARREFQKTTEVA